MVLTQEENDFLTRVGPGQPAGELLRRYWLPVCPVQEISDSHSTRFVRLLGEDLVLFRCAEGPGARGQGPGNGQGDSLAPDPRSQAPVRVGLIHDHCSHRGASLLYGRVEERGIACAYHGWLYDTSGNCLETPAEPADSKLYLTIKARAYPVQQFIGLYWAYLGPLPAPVIPRFDVWVRKDGHRHIYVHPQLDCNWVQPMENSADPAHLQILHQHPEQGRGAQSSTRGFIDTVETFDFYETWYGGLMKRRLYRDNEQRGTGGGEEHPILFPNILRVGNTTQIRVPMDDTHTYIVFVRFEPTPDGSVIDENEDELPTEWREPYKQPAQKLHPVARFRFTDPNQWDNQIQDYMAWETQGPIAPRPTEHLATSDRGIVMFRQMLQREIEKVLRGEDPVGVIRDPGHEMIDTKLQESLQRFYQRGTRVVAAVASPRDE